MALILRKLRKDRKMTLDTLSALSGVSKPFLSQIETGARNYSSQTIAQIAEALGVGMSEMFDDADEGRAAANSAIAELAQAMTDADRRQLEDYARFLIARRENAMND